MCEIYPSALTTESTGFVVSRMHNAVSTSSGGRWDIPCDSSQTLSKEGAGLFPVEPEQTRG